MVQQPNRYILGLDLGQPSEPTALAILEGAWNRPGQVRTYALRHLHRFPIGTRYADIADRLCKLLSKPPLIAAMLAVDQTAVGQAVIQTIRGILSGKVVCNFFPITITAGHEVVSDPKGGFHVPKKELVGTLQLFLQARRLQIARTLPDAQMLVRELQNFKTKVTISNNDQLEAWREGQHDDLVFAVALAAWLGERVRADARPVAGPPRYDWLQVLDRLQGCPQRERIF